MSGSNSSPIRERVSSLTRKDCVVTIKRMLKWWSEFQSLKETTGRQGWAPFALTVHEHREILCAGKKEETSSNAQNAGEQSDLFVFRRRPVSPWNARTDGRLKRFIQMNARGIVLPPPMFAGDQASAAAKAQRRWIHELVFLDIGVFEKDLDRALVRDESRKVGLSREELLGIVFDVEHAIALTWFRMDYSRRSEDRSIKKWKLNEKEIKNELVIKKARIRRECLLLSAVERYSGNWHMKECAALSCVVAYASGENGRLSIIWNRPFRGGGALCLQRLSDLLNFDLRKTNLAVGLRRKNENSAKREPRRTTVLQFAWMQKAIQESGDCAFERDIVREALKMAASQDAEPSQLPSVDPVLLGCNAIIAIARTDGKGWQAKALSELELVRNLWANHRRDKPGRVARKKASRTARAVQKANETYLDPHEANVWRQSRASEQSETASSAQIAIMSAAE